MSNYTPTVDTSIDPEISAMDNFIKAASQGKLPDQMSEHLSVWQPKAEILSVPRVDEKNHWRDFFCIEKMDPTAIAPTKGSENAAGYDLYAFEEFIIPAWGKNTITTKIKVTMPPGVYGRIASRSGLSFKNDLEVGAGVIDPDYQGEIKVILRNHSDLPYTVSRGDRVAQIILERYAALPIKVIGSQKDIHGTTKRSAGGFGSTGK